jgi:hypothetical protein
MGDYDESPDIDRGRRRYRRLPSAQSGRQRANIAEDKECRLRTRTIRRRLMLVEGHRPAQQKGVNCASVQNPLTSLHEASRPRRAIMRSRLTVLQATFWNDRDGGVDPSPPSSTCCAHLTRAQDYGAAKNHPMPPATAGIVNDDWGRLWRRLSCTTSRATCRRERRPYAVQCHSRSR